MQFAPGTPGGDSVFARQLHRLSRGRLLTAQGQVQYATVYVIEHKLGTIANTKGDYELKLPEGSCMVMYQSPGYEPQIINISLSEGEYRQGILSCRTVV